MYHVVVTGVSTGIGCATAKALITAGYHVFGSVRKELDIDRLRSELPSSFTPLLFDVTDAEAIREAVQQVCAICLFPEGSFASGADAYKPMTTYQAALQ